MHGILVRFFLVMHLAMKKVKKQYCDTSEKHIEEHGYRCGDIIHVYKSVHIDAKSVAEDSNGEEPLLFSREAHICGILIELWYYVPEGQAEIGRRIGTKYVCCYYYIDTTIAEDEDEDVDAK